MAKSELFMNVRWFAAWIGCIFFAEILGSVCFRSSISTIERRFTLSSTTTALLASSFQIGSMPVVLLVSYFGNRYHRPRSIGIGCLLMSFGFFMVAIPQFIGSRYQFHDISSENSSSLYGKLQTTCQETAANQTCGETETSKTDNNYLLILFGMIICGIGSTPAQPLGISYIDDYASKHNAALLIGLVLSIGLAAPAVGFLLGAFTLKLWVDIGWVDSSEIKISPVDPGWVGAWWIGLLVGSVLMLLSGLPMWFYPKELQKPKEEENTKEQKKSIMGDRVVPSLKIESGTLLSALKSLLTNPCYLLVISISTFEAFRIAGISVFSIKYFEVIFGKSASSGSFLIGAIYLPVLVVGTISGSIIVKHWKLSLIGITRLSLFSLFGSFVVSFPIMLIGCETIATAGLTVPYPGSNALNASFPLNNECNIDCNCNEKVYTPVCGPNNITYVSPCFAGCSSFTSNEDGIITSYTECSCIDEDLLSGSVTVGRCLESNCEELVWPVLALKTAGAFFSGLHVTPLLILMLRSLKSQEKAFGIGMAYFTFRLLAYIPGPVIFGSLIDRTCLHWTNKPCSTQSYCSVFESNGFRYTFGGVTIATQFCSLSAALFYYFKYARHDKSETDKHNPEANTSDKNRTNDDLHNQPILKEEAEPLTETII